MDRTEGGDFHLDIPAIQQIVTQAQAGVQVSSASSRELTFQGDKQLAFAFSCVRLYLNDDGKIVAMPPDLDTNRVFGYTRGRVVYSPDRVLLSREPAMVEWDEP